MKTYVPKKAEIQKNWYLVNAEGKILGRLASKIAQILSGKNKPIYTPHLDTGDFVVVINAKKIRVTGNKEERKKYIFIFDHPTFDVGRLMFNGRSFFRVFETWALPVPDP